MMIPSLPTVRLAPHIARFIEPEGPPTGYESPSEARDGGWLGQTPPPGPSYTPSPDPDPSPYANPHLAPDPWHADPTLPGTDPTLFG